MSMTHFAETVAQAIADYRLFLRKSKTVDQASRVNKISRLGLKQVNLYSSDVDLYNTAVAILADIRDTIDIPEEGYYSYSGIAKYYEYLDAFIANYEIEDDKVVHRAQRASRAILHAIQMINGKPAHVLNDTIKRDVYACQEIIIHCGDQPQLDIYRENLVKLKPNAPLFYTDLIRHFDQLVTEVKQAA